MQMGLGLTCLPHTPGLDRGIAIGAENVQKKMAGRPERFFDGQVHAMAKMAEEK